MREIDGICLSLRHAHRRIYSNNKRDIKRIVMISSVSSQFDRTGYRASAKRRDGLTTFCLIFFYTLRRLAVFHIAVNKENDCFPATIEVVFEGQSKALVLVRLVNDSNSKDNVLRCIDDYCRSHLDRFVTVVSVGDQNRSSFFMELVTEQKTFCNLKHKDCAREAFADVPHSVAGIEKATDFLKNDNKTVKSLAQASLWIEASTKRFCLKECKTSFQDKAKWVL